MTGRLREERGWAVLTTILVIAVMIALGLGTFAFVGGQQAQSRGERVTESAFNLAESAQNSAVLFLSVAWPTAAAPYPTCTQGSTSGACPDPSTVSAGFTSADYQGQPTWTTAVRDNGAPSSSYYGDAVTGTQPSYDANGDGAVWVRSEAVVQGRHRAVVALAKSLPIAEDFPQNAATVGKFMTTNNGKKPMLDLQGVASSALPLVVRCTTVTGPSSDPSEPCLRYDQTKNQVSPNIVQTNVAGAQCPSGALKCAMTDTALDRLRQRAKMANTYWGPGGLAGCPASLTGALVFVESTSPCSGGKLNFSGRNTFNSQSDPGILVIADGSFSLGGNATFYGLVYDANRTQSTAWDVLSVSGSGQIVGGVVIDYDGGLSAGAGKSLVFDPSVFDLVTSNAVGVPPGTFRELSVR
jgi:Tfp pilus assembly protein PilX